MSSILPQKIAVADMRLADLQKHEFATLIKENAGSFFDAVLLEKLDKIASAMKIPPSNNMGGTYPDTPYYFPQCEIKPSFSNQKTSIDWLGFSTLRDLDETLYGLRQIFPGLVRSGKKVGMKGYPSCVALDVDDVQIGLIGYGAKHGRLSVSLTGVACKKLNTTGKLQFAYEVLVLLDVRLSRIDICLDFYKGELTLDACIWAFEMGRFKKKTASGNPQFELRGAKGPHGENLGRTMYLGIRDSELFSRLYEKGLEVFAKMDQEYRELSTARSLEFDSKSSSGSIADDWLRLEGEFKRKDKLRPLSLEMMIDSDNFFAGAYPFFADMLGLASGRGRETLKDDSQIEYDKLLNSHRKSYGNHVHTMRDIGMSDSEIVDSLDTGMQNQKLIRSGIARRMKEAYQDHKINNPDLNVPF
jgi:DNA relaxase NicK